MFIPEPSISEAKLTEIINKHLDELAVMEHGTAEYKMKLERISELYKLKTAESEIEGRRHVSPDVLVSSIASLAGIMAILKYERVNILTSKAISFVTRLSR